MPSRTPFLLWLIVLAFAGALKKGESQIPGNFLTLNQFTFTITPANPDSEKAGIVGLVVRITNRAGKRVAVLYRHALRDYGLIVTDETGMEVPLFTKSREETLAEGEESVRGRTIADGATESIAIDLARIFVFDHPGTYTVRASWPHRPVVALPYSTVIDPVSGASLLFEPPPSAANRDESRDATRKGAPNVITATVKITVSALK